MQADLSYLQTGRRTVARILVGLQIYKGLADRLPIESASGTHIQLIDYKGLPFRFHRCHELGHLVAQCSRASHVTLKGAVSQSSGERSLTRNVAGAQVDIGDKLSSTARPVAAEDVLPPQSIPEACTLLGVELTILARTSAAIVSSSMQSSPHTRLFFPRLSQVISSFPNISLGASSNPIVSSVTPIVTTIPPIERRPLDCGLERFQVSFVERIPGQV